MYSFHEAVEPYGSDGRGRCVMEQVKISVKPVREVVLVELYAGNVSARAFQLVYDDVFARLDQLIDAGMACWIKSRADHFVVKTQRDVSSIELAAEIKKQLRL